MRRILAAMWMCSLLACVQVVPSVDAGNEGGGGGRTTTGGGGGSTATGGGGGGGSTTGGGGGMTMNTDVIAPELLDTTPSSGSTNVAFGQQLQLIFSEPMDPASLQLTASPTIRFGTPVANASGTLFTVAHGGLSFDTAFTVTIAASDLAGNALAPQTLSFRTEAAPDMTAPTLVRSIPSANATGVAVTSPLTVVFSEPMDRSSVQITATPSTTFGPLAFAVNDSEVTLNPSADLTPNTSYTLSVRGSDVSGNALAPQTITFTTEAPRDTTAPSLTSSTPSSGQANVATSTRLSFTFSEAMSEASLSVDLSPAIDLGTPTFSNQGRTATFAAPVGTLAAARTYVVTVEADDLAGNALPATTFSFTTAAPPDTTRPTVASTSPSANSTNVPVNSNLEFNFSEPMDEAATEAAFTSSPAITNRVITWNAAHTLMSVNPGVDLPSGANVTMTIGLGARDLAGNTVAASRSFSFTTAAAPDTTRPSIVAVSPTNGAVGVIRSTSITVTFSEPMRQSTAQTAFQIISPTGFNGGVFSWNPTSTQMTYNPPADFDQGTLVQYVINTAAEDLAGNGMALNANRSFRVKRIETKSFYAFGNTDSAMSDARAGYIRSNADCTSASVTTGSSAIAGDDYQGFMTFSLAPLAALDNVVIRLAMLSVEQTVCASLIGGAPFDSDILISHVDYGATLSVGDCNTPTLGGRTSTISDSGTAGRRTELVTSEVRDDFANRGTRGNRSQFRFHTARSGGPNLCNFASQNASSNRPFIRITYEFD